MNKKQRQNRNLIIVTIVYALIIGLIFLVDYLGLVEKKVYLDNRPCAIVGDEVITIDECYDVMLNGF